jgi:hypothetical protein
MNRETFDVRLQVCLDERRDPLDDPALVAWLDAHPDQLEAFAEQRRRFAVLALPDPPPLSLPKRRRWIASVGIAAAACIAALLLKTNDRAAPSLTSRAPGRILAAVIEPFVAPVGVVAPVRTTEVLIAQPGVRVEMFTQWHVERTGEFR